MGVRIEGAFADYWNARSSNLRKSVARRMRRLQDAGLEQRIERLTEPAEMVAAIARFGMLESKGWKGEAGTAVHADNIQGKFYKEVMTRFADRGRATVYQLYFNETLVAMQLCIASANVQVLLKTSYDEDYSSHSPGRLLLYALLEQEFSRNTAREVEFYTDANSDQLAWASHDRWINHCLLFRNALLQTTYHTLRSLAARLSGVLH
jgi:CelD/BcsL family acetyltransferase involved in cellulose biosynthesis